MKHYKLLKEHDSHFDIEHEKQGKFVIAKYGLDDATIDKIRKLGAAHYAEGTEDARGVKPEDAPALMLADQPPQEPDNLILRNEDQGLKAADYLLLRNDQMTPTVPIPLRDDENYRIAQEMRAREEGLVPTGRTKGVDIPEGGDVLDKSPYMQGLEQRTYPWSGEQPVVTTPEPSTDQEGLGLTDSFVESDLPATTPAKKSDSVTSYVQTKPLKIEGKPPETIWSKITNEFSEFVNKSDVLQELKKGEAERLAPSLQKPQKEDSILEGLQGLKKKFNEFVEERGKQFKEQFGGAPAPGQELSPGEAARYGLPPGSKMPAAPVKPKVADVAQEKAEAAEAAAAAAAGKKLPYQIQTEKGLGRGVSGVPAAPPSATQVAGTGMQGDTLKAADEAFKGLKQANLDIAKIQTQQELDAGEAQLRALNNLRKLDTDYQKNLKDINDEQKRLADGVANFKIDPNRVFTKMSTGNRVLAAISILLGGIGQGILGTKSNAAMDVLMDSINRDIDAQKANLGVKQSLLALNLEKYRRLDAATAVTRAQLMNVVQAQINLAAAKANSGLAVKNAQIANYKLEMEKAKLNQSVATQATLGQVLNTQQGVPAEYVMQLPEDTRALLVRVPNGRFYPAKSVKDAEKANDALGETTGLQDLLTRADSIMAKSPAMPWDSADKAFIESFGAQTQFYVQKLQGLGVLNEGDLRIVGELKPDLGAYLFRDREKEKLILLKKYFNDKINGFLIQRVPNYSPGNIFEKGVE